MAPTLLLAAAAAAAALDLRRASVPLRVLAFVLLLAALAARLATFMDGSCPVTSTAGGLGLVSFLLALHLAIGFPFRGQERVRPLVLLVAAALLDLAALALAPSPGGVGYAPRPLAERAFAELHGGAIFLGYAAFVVALLHSLLYLALHRLVKRRQLGFWFSRMPSLQRLESRAGVAVAVGFVALTIGLALGCISFHRLHGGLPWADPKFVGATLAWGVFGLDLWLRRVAKWGGVRVALLPPVGVLVLGLQLALPATGHPFWGTP